MATARRLTYTWGQGLPGGIGGLLDLCQGGAQYSYLYDGKGNVTALLDANANIAATYAYGPFGEPRVPSNYLQQPMQFSTKPYDENTGLSYYGYRFYVPALGRWLTRDPIGERGGINLYGFVGNDPINLIDPYGLVPPCKGTWVPVAWDADYSHWHCNCYWRCVPWDDPHPSSPKLCDDYRNLPKTTSRREAGGGGCVCDSPPSRDWGPLPAPRFDPKNPPKTREPGYWSER
ncbi:MAG: RHS repeat-associated core domain-containing protein [Candidatus Diapherotrites archaeon]